MNTKMDRGRLPEWMMLDLVFAAGMMAYILSQLLVIGHVTDLLFIILLMSATVFLNFRQWDLYNTLMKDEGKEFFLEIYSRDEHEKQVKNIFLHPADNFIAVGYAIAFAIVMFMFDVWDSSPVIKIFFSVFLFTANIPTGYAILRILKYFYYNILWIKRLDFGFGLTNRFSERYIKKVCSKVLFTAATYCTVSLSSILFTEIELNILVMLYTIFAAILVIASLSLTSVLLRRKRQSNRFRIMDEIDVRISSLVEMTLEDSKANDETMGKMKELIEIKDYIANQTQSKVTVSKLLSSIGLLFITVIPVILQWLLELMMN